MEQLNRIELRGSVGFVRVQNFENTRVARFSLATNVAYKDRDGGPVIETTWHNISAWEGRGVKDLDQIEKGTKLYVQGRVRNQKYTASDGVEHISSEVLANRIVIIDVNEPLQYEM